MILRASRSDVARWRALRQMALVVSSLALAHEAIYWTAGQTSLSPEDGAHGYWPAMLLAAAVGALLLAARSIWRVGRAAIAPDAPVRVAPTTLAGEWRSIVGRLLPTVALAYFALENVEHFLAQGHMDGIDVFLVPGRLQSFPVLVIVIAIVGAMGALVRWQEAVVARMGNRRRSRARRRLRARSKPAWSDGPQVARHARLLTSQDLGRAPPVPSV